MIDRIITLQLGGKERTLLFGTMGYFEHIREHTKKEPFDWLQEFDEKRKAAEEGRVSVMIEDIAILIYAGLNSYLDNVDEENIEFKKVKKWCNGLTFEVATNVCLSAFGGLATEEPGEPLTQAANGELKVKEGS